MSDRASFNWRRYRLLRFLSSVWLGVTLLFLIVVYASVASAVPQVRGAIEMSEMEVFRHWLFTTLCGLFCVSLILATLLRCRWNASGAGALIVHAGLLLLVGGSAWYFGTKVEGDVLLFSPSIEVSSSKDGVPRATDTFLADRGQGWEGMTADHKKRVRIRVLETRMSGMLPVAEAKLEVRVDDDPPTEITLSAAGTRRTSVQDDLSVHLRTAAPTSRFYDHELAGLYYRKLNDPQAVQHCAGLSRLPWYRERYLDAGYMIHDAGGAEVPSKRVSPYLSLAGLHIPTGWFEHWRMPIRPQTPELPFEVEITGYLPYTSETGFDAYTQDGRHLAENELSSADMARMQIVPRVQPLELRRPGLGRGPSAIRLKFTGTGALAGWSETQWCPFSQYPHVDTVPIRVHAPNSPDTWEFIYSRYERDLGATLAGGKLSVKFFPGRQSAESWRSDFFAQRTGATAPVAAAVYTNQTYALGPYTLFQSGAATDHWSWTILGVGNRRGIWPMTLGCVLIVLGTLYAFYAKPLILRRRLARRGAEREPYQQEASHASSLATAEAPV
jgi:hypothetical protein